jgi:hypothetical protein
MIAMGLLHASVQYPTPPYTQLYKRWYPCSLLGDVPSVATQTRSSGLCVESVGMSMPKRSP